MINDDKNIIENIKKGVLDCNNQELFFPTVFKGFILKMNEEISIRNIKIPHFIINTGDEMLYLEKKGYDFSKEPLENTNENYIYNTIPRCMIEPKGINLIPDQLTSPYGRGVFELQSNNNIYNVSAEFRRMPLTISSDITYYTNSFTDMLELIQQLITKLSFIRVFNITYMGLCIECSYALPEAFDSELLMELTGSTEDNKCRKLSLSLEISTNMPIFDNRTAASTGNIITNLSRTKINGHDITSAYTINPIS